MRLVYQSSELEIECVIQKGVRIVIFGGDTNASKLGSRQSQKRFEIDRGRVRSFLGSIAKRRGLLTLNLRPLFYDPFGVCA